jgi:hypothetical protein
MGLDGDGVAYSSVGEGTRCPATYSSSKKDILATGGGDGALEAASSVRGLGAPKMRSLTRRQSALDAACSVYGPGVPNMRVLARRQSSSACSSERWSSSNIHAARGRKGRRLLCVGGGMRGYGRIIARLGGRGG